MLRRINKRLCSLHDTTTKRKSHNNNRYTNENIKMELSIKDDGDTDDNDVSIIKLGTVHSDEKESCLSEMINRATDQYNCGNYQGSYNCFLHAVALIPTHEQPATEVTNDKIGDTAMMTAVPNFVEDTKEGRYKSTADTSRWEPSPDTFIYQREHYDEGMNVFMGLENVDVSNTGCNTYTTLVATLLFNAGQSKYHMQEWQGAFECYEKAFFEIFLCSENPSSSSSATTKTATPSVIIPILHSLGRLAYYRQYNLKRAIDAYTKALMYCRSIYGNTHLITAATLNCLGTMYYHFSHEQQGELAENASTPQERMDQSMTYLREALDIRRTILGSSHVDVATTLYNIGRVFALQNSNDEALKYYEEAFDIRRVKLGPSNFDYVDTGLVIANALKRKGFLNTEEYERAIELYKDFVLVAGEKFSSSSHRDIADAIFSIGQIYYERQDYKKALDNFTQSFDVAKESIGLYHRETSCILDWIGTTQYIQRNFSAAIEAYYKELHIEHVVYNSSKSKNSDGNDESDNSIASSTKATIQAKHHQSENIIITLMNIGCVHMETGEQDQAMECYKKALGLVEKLQESCCNNAMEIESDGDSSENGNFYFDQSSSLVVKESHVSLMYYNMGVIYNEAKMDDDKALKCFQRALEIKKRGNMCKQDDDDSDHEGAKCNSSSSNNKKRMKDYTDIAKILNKVGNIYLMKGSSNVHLMMDAFVEASRIYRDDLGTDPFENVIVDGHMYEYDRSMPPASPVA